MLNIKHYQIRKRHKLIKLCDKIRVLRSIGYSRRINARVNIVLLAQRKQIDQKINLHKGLSARHC